jgi:hypothetical protein
MDYRRMHTGDAAGTSAQQLLESAPTDEVPSFLYAMPVRQQTSPEDSGPSSPHLGYATLWNGESQLCCAAETRETLLSLTGDGHYPSPKWTTLSELC